jgi:hypothetical protein
LSEFVLVVKTSLMWQTANLAAELLRLRYPSNAARIRYDSLLRLGAPEGLQDILPEGPLEGLTLENDDGDYHSLGGNVMRNREAVVVRLDDAWRDQIPRSLSILVTAISLPLILRYGFGLRRTRMS